MVETGRQPPKGRADDDDLRRAPGHQGRESRPVVLGFAPGQHLRREAVAFLHAGEGRGRRQRAQPRRAIGRPAARGAVHHLLEHVRHGGAVGVSLEEGPVAEWGGGVLDVPDDAEEDLPDEGEE